MGKKPTCLATVNGSVHNSRYAVELRMQCNSSRIDSGFWLPPCQIILIQTSQCLTSNLSNYHNSFLFTLLIPFQMSIQMHLHCVRTFFSVHLFKLWILHRQWFGSMYNALHRFSLIFWEWRCLEMTWLLFFFSFFFPLTTLRFLLFSPQLAYSET